MSRGPKVGAPFGKSAVTFCVLEFGLVSFFSAAGVKDRSGEMVPVLSST